MAEPLRVAEHNLDELCINTIRTLAMDAVERAKSGHPGAPMGLAPLAYVLWTRHLRHNPADPTWPGRDRFVLSCGHASMLLYSLLYLTGYDLTLDDLKDFRRWQSRTPGHPEFGLTPGVETTTGPLGQGFGNAVGMAIAEAHLAARFNRPGHRVIDHYTFFMASDGDFMEGVSHEVSSLAGHVGLGKLIGFYDSNRVTIDGSTSLTFSDDTAARFEAYGWHVQSVEDGNDIAAIDRAIVEAKKVMDRPSLVIVHTHIAYGSPNKQDSSSAHGAALGEEEVKLTKENLGWPYPDPFYVPAEALAEWRRCGKQGQRLQDESERAFENYARSYPGDAAELKRRLDGLLPEGWEETLPDLSGVDTPMATRVASGKVINAIAEKIPELIGGSGDLGSSNDTIINAGANLSRDDPAGRNIFYGVREHAMGTILNGIALHGGFVPFGGTFLIFSDYMRPPIRLAALMGVKVIYVFTHDSIGLGEDGPTHQPIEILPGLRAVPNLVVIRPADAAETVEAWRWALKHEGGPVALVLTRQKLPPIDRGRLAGAGALKRGGYVLSDAPAGEPQLILLASGSEVAVVLDAQKKLEFSGVPTRVVSMPSLQLFESESPEYQNEVLPPDVKARLAVEAAHPMSWYRWVGDDGDVLGIERYGASAPYKDMFEGYGFTADNIVARVKRLLGR